ncbi:SusD/RagB family nutrient-binding outer membrane lipoprotein [Halosquirtibacter xylanolyticus]|uniref:SusD/RagB family nutrient-binding outer membrane lipoprotein n=1 Tax=Halosquirtibacter xylanolyticus TaxID=3374599 RepID=UPI0037499020|nr:SusD/RagB family nutrient-binding outer membrane lipoprotein [Prolixibacteraceae bacterium]
MNTKYLYKIYIAIILISTSCTSKFEEMNKDPFKVKEVSTGPLFGTIQKNIFQDLHWMYQIQENLIGDLYSGYMAPPTPFNSDHFNSTYSLMENWNETPYNYRVTGVMKPVDVILKLSDEKSTDFIAIAKILRVAAMHQATDSYGPLPYSSYGMYDTYAPYESQEEVYTSFFKDLEEADQHLKEYIEKNPGKSGFKKYDYIFGGDYTKWRKYCNSLRLRLAMRISNKDIAKAKIEAEKALSNGILTESDGVVGMLDINADNPLYIISNVWQDTKLGANMESILVGLKDPRLEKYFLPTQNKKAIKLGPNYTLSTGEKVRFQGIRNGIRLVSKDQRKDFSTLGALWQADKQKSTPIYFMVPAEMYFLRAEGALKGFNMNGEAGELYKQGIQASMKQWDIPTIDAYNYITDNTSQPADYIDPANQDNNIKAVSKVTIQWDSSLSKEEKLEKIITQKWIANFPIGQEAWSEFRRTGYPKLQPIKINESQSFETGQIDTEIMIRRLPFPRSEVNNNYNEMQKATKLLSSGKNTAGTRLWWDTGVNIFD